MAKGYTMKFLADVGSFIKGANQASDALEDVADVLDDVQREAKDTSKETEKTFDKADDSASAYERSLKKTADALADVKDQAKKTGGKIEDSFDDAAKDTAKAAEKTEKSFREAFSQITRDSQKAKTATSQDARQMENAFDEAGDEIRQNWGETMSNFDGSAQSAVDIIADSFGGLAASLGVGGPLGTLFLGAAAGVVSYFGTKWIEGFEKVEERNKQMYDQLLENADAYFSQEQIVENYQKILSQAEDAMIDISTVEKMAETTGLSHQTIALAFADVNGKAAEELSRAIEDAQTRINAEKAQRSTIERAVRGAHGAHDTREEQSLRLAATAWEKHTDAIRRNSDEIKTNRDFLNQYGIGLDTATSATRDYVQAVAEQATALADVKTAISENVEAHGSQAAAVEANKAELAGFVDELLSVQDAADQTGASADELTALQYEQAAAFLEAAEAAGFSASEAADLAREYGLIPESVATNIKTTGVDGARTKAQNLRSDLKKIPASVTTNVKINAPTQGTLAGMISQIQAGLPTIKINTSLASPRMSFQ